MSHLRLRVGWAFGFDRLDRDEAEAEIADSGQDTVERGLVGEHTREGGLPDRCVRHLQPLEPGRPLRVQLSADPDPVHGCSIHRPWPPSRRPSGRLMELTLGLNPRPPHPSKDHIRGLDFWVFAAAGEVGAGPAGSQPKRPSSRPRAIASTRFAAPSFPAMAWTWALTVPRARYSSAAIWRWERPAATRRRTSSSRSVRGSTSSAVAPETSLGPAAS